MVTKSPIKLTHSQKKLLSVSDQDSGFSIDTPLEPKMETSTTISTSDIVDSFCSSRSSFLSNNSLSMLSPGIANVSQVSDDSNATISSNNRSLTSSSWTYHPNKLNSSFTQSKLSPTSSSPQHQQNELIRRKMSPSSFNQKLNSSYIFDEQSLSQYLKEFEDKEQSSVKDQTNSSGSFWNYSPSPVDYTSQLMRYQYQIASRSQHSASHKDDLDSPTKFSNHQVWQKLEVKNEEVDLWTERLRKWITQTIIVNVVDEINNINKLLSSSRSSRNLTIGGLPIKLAFQHFGQIAFSNAGQIPHLSTLLPFLDVCSTQEYLVHRLKSLASGGCMSSFKWNGGGTFKGKPWDEHLPTDSVIVMHQLCTYLDARTPFHPNYPDGRTFTSQYFVKTSDKPDTTKKDHLYIYQSQINPPYYKLVTNGNTYDLPEGYNNMFHVILLFLYHVQKDHSGILGRLSFGKPGINMLSILDPSS
ncbi:Transmembrane protein 209 [Nymphon striatum]|nr:Transmembrane protein 209 [Nymphon striatum]